MSKTIIFWTNRSLSTVIMRLRQLKSPAPALTQPGILVSGSCSAIIEEELCKTIFKCNPRFLLSPPASDYEINRLLVRRLT